MTSALPDQFKRAEPPLCKKIAFKKGCQLQLFFKYCLYNKKKLTVPQSARKLVTSHH